MLLKNVLLRIVPLKHHLPLRYLVEKVIGHLEPEIFLLRELVGKGELVIDVGANFGIYSYALAKLCKRVEVFEPLPRCAETIMAYNAPNIHVHNVGLSSAGGTLRLFTPIVNGIAYTAWSSFRRPAGEHDSLDVPVRTLDDYDFRDVSFIKIDAEGHELEILKGAAATIRREKPVLLVEIEQRHLDFPMDVVFGHLLDSGYRGYFYRNAGMHSLAEFSHDVHQGPVTDDTSGKGRVANFIFKP